MNARFLVGVQFSVSLVSGISSSSLLFSSSDPHRRFFAFKSGWTTSGCRIEGFLAGFCKSFDFEGDLVGEDGLFGSSRVVSVDSVSPR